MMTATCLIKRFTSCTLYIALVMGLLFLTGCSKEANKDEPAQHVAKKEISYELYKSPTCGCCGKWQDHMQAQGFVAHVNHPQDLYAFKETLGIQPRYQSCHTAVFANGLFVEGHIPARYVEQFLENPPEGAIGLSVPGMPVGSPGMEVENRFMPYDILLLKKDGTVETYARVESIEQQYK